jgi:lipopolysaccharide/colanic/teichoic acid biosynthesis glycosyltransferase
MRAVVWATGLCPEMESFSRRQPPALLPVAGRPFLHYVIESLVDCGITKIDFILSDMPEKIEESLGDGTRWGCVFRYHLTRDAARPYGRLSVIGIESDEPVLLAHGDRLPLWRAESSPRCTLVFHDGSWTGWGIVPSSVLRAIRDDWDETALSAHLSAQPDISSQDVALLLNMRSFAGLLEANWAVLEKRFPKVLLSGREAGEGIWISRNVSLHPTARLTAPVYIGENCRINAGVQLGPRVVISSDCLVDQSSTLADTVVFAGSYVGQALELNQSIVDRNRLVSVKAATEILVADNFILGSFVERNLLQLAKRTGSQILACLLLVLLSPLLLLAWLWCRLTGKGPAVRRKDVVRLPVSDEADYATYRLISFCPSPEVHQREVHQHGAAAHEFFLHFLPGLLNVALSHLTLVGVAPRTAQEIDALPQDWKQLYLESIAGLITEAYVVHGAAPSEDQLYSAEVFYAATVSARHDAGLTAGYVARLLGLKRRHEPLDTPAGMEE